MNGVLIYIAQVCGDPIKGVYTILLTPRVYNSSNTGNSTGIHYVRKRFNTEVVNVIDGN